MKIINRRNYHSTSNKFDMIHIPNLKNIKDKHLISSDITKRKSSTINPNNQNNYVKTLQKSESRRYKTIGSTSKTNYQYEISARVKTQCRQDILKENKSIRIRQKPSHRLMNSFLKPFKQQIQTKQALKKAKSDFIHHYQYSVGGHKGKPNQDNIFCEQNIYIICDGHGSEGGMVSSICWPKTFMYYSFNKDYSISNKEQKSVSQKTISKIFQYTKEELEDESQINLETSGSTALMIQIIENTIYCANVGDCRAIMSKKGVLIQLNNQHKPNKTKERQRIYRMGGIIKKSSNGPYRIYNPQKKIATRGLSVSRGFGDKDLSAWGLTYQPQIMKFQIEQETQFIVMGSDGFFQFFEPQQVLIYTNKLLKNKNSNIAQELVKQSIKRWIGFSETDDISCIVIIF